LNNRTENAKNRSNFIFESTDSCLFFKYRFVPGTLNSQQVYSSLSITYITTKGESNVTLWTTDKLNSTESIRAESNWMDAMVHIVIPDMFRLIIKAVSNSSHAFIALDNIRFESNACTSPTSMPSTVKSVTVSPSTTLDCDFESANLCNWHINSTLKDRFSINDPSNRMTKSPVYDHTKKNFRGIQ